MNHETYIFFDNACISGDLEKIQKILINHKPSLNQLNTALRHAVYYTSPNLETRDHIIDELIDHGARVDWDDRGVETIVNATNPRSPYLLKRVLNTCDGNQIKLGIAIDIIKIKPRSQWAIELIQSRTGGILHIGF